MLKSKRIGRKVEDIIENFDLLKRFLRDRAICKENEIVIVDPPVTIRILKREEMMIFNCNGKDVVLDREGIVEAVEENVIDLIDEWCTALTSLGFKRYIPKRR